MGQHVVPPMLCVLKSTEKVSRGQGVLFGFLLAKKSLICTQKKCQKNEEIDGF